MVGRLGAPVAERAAEPVCRQTTSMHPPQKHQQRPTEQRLGRLLRHLAHIPTSGVRLLLHRLDCALHVGPSGEAVRVSEADINDGLPYSCSGWIPVIVTVQRREYAPAGGRAQVLGQSMLT